MKLKFSIPSASNPTDLEEHIFLFTSSSWDDYSFKTSFQVTYCGQHNNRLDLGSVKVGFVDQPHGWTKDHMEPEFDFLKPDWFSIGQDVVYYETLRSELPENVANEFLARMRDAATDQNVFASMSGEKVFQHSLMRSVSLSIIQGQYRRVLEGLPALSEYKFSYRDPGNDHRAAINLSFRVIPDSKPPTNVHVIIGRNGIGKTTLLNNMVSSALAKQSPADCTGKFYTRDKSNFNEVDLPKDYFSSVVSVSFSAFDPFVPPSDQPDRSKGLGYFYIGMKKRQDIGSGLRCVAKSKEDFINDILESIDACLSQPPKRKRWFSAISRLESDPNFADIGFGKLAELDNEGIGPVVKNLVEEMSSGHSIVLLTLTKLVETVEEKTLVLMDEPESHLHPPLLSALTRALSDLLHNRNAVAIIATHSPVIVQEVPSSCVWKITRSGYQARADRPDGETFGENVGVLTREIFGLEVSKAGFHALLQTSVNEGGSFDDIMAAYGEHLGFEAQAILQAMIRNREHNEKSSNEDNR